MNIFTKKLLTVLSLSIVSMAGMAQAVGDYRSRADGNWNTEATWERCSSITPVTWAIPLNNGTQGYPGENYVPATVTIQAAHDVDLSASPARNIGSLVLGGGGAFSFDGGTLTTTGNPALTIDNNLTINSFWADATFGGSGLLTVTGAIDVNAGGFFTRNGSGNTIVGRIDLGALGFFTQSSTGNLTVNTTSQIDGFFEDDETTGVTTFTGLVTNTGSGIAGSFTSTTVTQENRMIFNGGITNSGTFTAGGIQLATNQTITANAAMTIQSGLDCDANLTIAGNSTVSVTGDESNIAPLGSTGGAAGNLTINAGATLALTGIAGAGVLDVTGNTIINGTLTLNSASQGNADFRGTFTNGGTFTDSNNSGVNTFYGAVTNTGTFTTTAVTTAANTIFQNGIANNGTFNAGAATFNTRAQDLTGGSTITFAGLVVVTGFTVTNSNTSAVTMSLSNADVLSGTGTWTQGANSTLNYSGSSLTITAFNASNSGNTVNYDRPGIATLRNPSASTYHHLTISGLNTKTSSGNHDINGNLSISGTAQLNVSTGTDNILVGGNWTVTSGNADPFVQGAQTVTFDGTGTQTISTTLAGGETFNNLIINKASGNAVLSSSPATTINVGGTLSLTTGGLQLNGNTLSITNTVTTAIGRTNGFIISETTGTPYSPVVWTMGTVIGTYTFPFATASGSYIPFVFNKTAAGTGAAGRISVATYPTAANNTPLPSGVTKMLNISGADNTANTVDRFWIITPSVYTVDPTASITFTATAAEVGTITTLRGQRWNTGAADWDLPLAGQSSTAVSATVPGVTVFSPWTMTGNNSPLPIELKSFSAILKQNFVELNWQTTSELNNDYFTIERAVNIEDFDPIGQNIIGKGTTSEVHSYQSIDAHPIFGRSYYRLKQTDFDGKFTYSDVRMIDYEGAQFVAYPSPSHGSRITVEMKVEKEVKSVPIQIVNMQGQRVFEQSFEVKVPGMLREEIVFENALSPGLYIIKSGSVLLHSQKIVVE